MRSSANRVRNGIERNRSWWGTGGVALLVLSLAFVVTACSLPGSAPGGAAPTAAPALPTYAPPDQAAGSTDGSAATAAQAASTTAGADSTAAPAAAGGQADAALLHRQISLQPLMPRIRRPTRPRPAPAAATPPRSPPTSRWPFPPRSPARCSKCWWT